MYITSRLHIQDCISRNPCAIYRFLLCFQPDSGELKHRLDYLQKNYAFYLITNDDKCDFVVL